MYNEWIGGGTFLDVKDLLECDTIKGISTQSVHCFGRKGDQSDITRSSSSSSSSSITSSITSSGTSSSRITIPILNECSSTFYNIPCHSCTTSNGCCGNGSGRRLSCHHHHRHSSDQGPMWLWMWMIPQP